ncbi:aldo/keto reductase [Nakamurella flavida]|uniref:Aldo/keto reductase n=1 Tax=Nakamurella flavida TaxID=363630 RepID=A0A939C4I0_9ACTN|nr:aldo/keto reductase [Nakamurella flavida]MBM9475247.1 aldo/keto reductase [Nakamurella flavida]MDP9776820.1 aryl-alcohol dehydrogenase-like predicted oxidoreductase [Nakamurella flavida]
MDGRRVGRSGLRVSRLGLGTMTWGRDTDAEAAAAQLESFVTAGGTFVDTSNVYGDGKAEEMLGSLVPVVVPRSSIVLGTTTVGVGGGRRALLDALDATLVRLGTDHVDLWQVHGFDTGVPYEETATALQIAVDSGRAGYIGLSGQNAWQAATLSAHLGTGRYRVVSLEVEYSLVERSAEDAILPAAAVHDWGVLGWAPLGRGVLTGKYRHGTPPDSRGASAHFARYVGKHRTERAARIVEATVTAAQGLGCTPLAVACAWARDRPGIASVVLGARDAGQLTAALAAEELILPAEIRAALDEVSDPFDAPI